MVNAFCGEILSLCDITNGTVLLSLTAMAHDQSCHVSCHLVVSWLNLTCVGLIVNIDVSLQHGSQLLVYASAIWL